MGSARQNDVPPFMSSFRERGKGGNGLVVNQAKGGKNLQLLHILGEISGGHPLVDFLMAGKIVEFLEPGLDVMTGNTLALLNRLQVDLCLNGFIGRDRFFRDGEAKLPLSAHDRNPEVALEDDAAFGGPDLLHGTGSVTIG